MSVTVVTPPKAMSSPGVAAAMAARSALKIVRAKIAVRIVGRSVVVMMAVVRNVFAMIAVSDPAAVSRAVKAVAMAVDLALEHFEEEAKRA